MIETCKNYCVLKAFDIDGDMLGKCRELAAVDGVSLECKQQNLDCKLTLVNKSASDIVFQKILDGILEILKSNVYANYDTTLEQCVIENARSKGAKIAYGRNDLFQACQRAGKQRCAIRGIRYLRRFVQGEKIARQIGDDRGIWRGKRRSRL